MADRPLALDIATRTGWAVGDAGARPVSGVWMLGGQGRPALYSAFLSFLDDALRVHRPTRIVAEQPLPPQAQRSEDVALALLGFRAHLELFAYDNSIPLSFVKYSEPRQACLGRSNFPKGQAKIAIEAWCEAHGFLPRDDNEADALLIWHFATGWRRQPELASPLDSARRHLGTAA